MSAAASAAALIVFSTTNTGLLALKAAMFCLRAKTPVLVVIHQILNGILDRHPKPLRTRPLELRNVLRYPTPRTLGYIALGESIQRGVAEVLPHVARRFYPLDQPCFRRAGDDALLHQAPEVLRFGYLGVASHGFERFCRLAAQVTALRPAGPYQFLMAGFVNEPHGTCPPGAESVVAGISRTPLSPEEYARRVASLTYAVGTWEPAEYHLTASASFLDAVMEAKPGIYLRNRYVEHCFARLGDIGYLCDDEEQMLRAMLSVIDEFPLQRYRRQQQLLAEGRRLFEPQTLAPKLRAIVEGMR
jgi:hypothetical protein